MLQIRIENINLYKYFIKSQLASLIATCIDFFITFFLTDVFKIWYLISTITGTTAGGCANFMLGRHWVYKKNKESAKEQAIRYSLIWFLSLVLNATGVYILTDLLGFNYKYSKISISILVGIFFNFYFQKLFVYKAK